jgi:hypothetical protein
LAGFTGEESARIATVRTFDGFEDEFLASSCELQPPWQVVGLGAVCMSDAGVILGKTGDANAETGYRVEDI